MIGGFLENFWFILEKLFGSSCEYDSVSYMPHWTFGVVTQLIFMETKSSVVKIIFRVVSCENGSNSFSTPWSSPHPLPLPCHELWLPRPRAKILLLEGKTVPASVSMIKNTIAHQSHSYFKVHLPGILYYLVVYEERMNHAYSFLKFLKAAHDNDEDSDDNWMTMTTSKSNLIQKPICISVPKS